MLDGKKLLVKILQKLETIKETQFVTEGVNCGQYTTKANSFSKVSKAVTKAGYRPLGIVGYTIGWVAGDTGKANVYLLNIDSIADGSCTVSAGVFNTTTAQIKFDFTAYILWVKI